MTIVGVDREEPLAAVSGLLDLFRRQEIIVSQAERTGMARYTHAITASWDRKFPGFPTQYFPYTSMRGQHFRGKRDAYLKTIITQLLTETNTTDTLIVNPACVFGRHACELASRLPKVRVIAADIDPKWYQVYRFLRRNRLPGNYTFRVDNIFAPTLSERPTAVVFFGACGAVSDGALDYAVESGARFIMCRTCCHDNIGGNVEVAKRSNSINRFFRFKNWAYGRMKTNPRYAGFYFSQKYNREAYPRSEAVRRLSSADEFQEVAGYTADSDICRAIIDLDRYLYLVEQGFSVEYQGELFVAERR